LVHLLDKQSEYIWYGGGTPRSRSATASCLLVSWCSV
jgi:hypothetical protein